MRTIILLENLLVVQLVNKYLSVMEPERLLSCWLLFLPLGTVLNHFHLNQIITQLHHIYLTSRVIVSSHLSLCFQDIISH
jgi:hypothetical protein